MIEEGYTAQHVWMKEHDGGAPMRYRVKAAEEIVEAMPNRLKTLGANKAVREALRADGLRVLAVATGPYEVRLDVINLFDRVYQIRN